MAEASGSTRREKEGAGRGGARGARGNDGAGWLGTGRRECVVDGVDRGVVWMREIGG